MKPIPIVLFALMLAVGAGAPICAADVADDPYVWLETLDGPEVMKWVHAENNKTLAVLERDPRFDASYRDALAILEASDRIPMPTFIDHRLFNFWQDGDHVRGIWRFTDPQSYDAPAPRWTTLLDLDQVAKSENANLVWKEVACEEPTERRCLLSLSDGGEDAVTVREFDVRRGAFVPEGFRLPRGKQSAAWEDGNTLLVSREWQPGELTTSGYPFIVKRLHHGEPLESAREIFRGSANDGGYGVAPLVLVDAEGRRAALILRPVSTFEIETYVVTPKGVARLALPKKATVHELYAGQLIVSLEEPWNVDGKVVRDGAVVALDLADLKRTPDALHPVVVYQPGPRETFLDARATRDALLVMALDNVRGRVFAYRRGKDGAWTRRTVQLLDNASVSIEAADPRGHEAFASVQGFLNPTSLWRIDARTKSATRVKDLPAKFDTTHLSVEQREAVSTDGTHIPYFLVGPKALKLDASNPTILYAYGGFQVAMTPSYSPVLGKLWLESGGVFVLANIRGGGEFGPAWHEAGLKTKRQIIYDDFAAVAKDLIARRITSPRRLGIQGGSNGGLLMGVEFTQHPELWHAVDIQVPLLDMLRFESIQAGSSWVGEYGSTSNTDERAFLASISPYANLRRRVDYPRPLVWTTTKDDRVGPQHARKFAARLGEYGIPYYFYEVTEGGHGAGANLPETARTQAIEMTYFLQQLKDP